MRLIEAAIPAGACERTPVLAAGLGVALAYSGCMVIAFCYRYETWRRLCQP